MRMTDKELELMTTATAIAHQNISLEKQESTAKQIFQAAYNIIRDSEKWCKFTMHRQENLGRKYKMLVMPICEALENSPLETELTIETYIDIRHSYCSIGAIYVADGRSFENNLLNSNKLSKAANEVYQALQQYARWVGYPNIAMLNDNVEHSTIVGAWRRVGEENGWL